MIFLNSTAEILRVVTGSAADVEFDVSYADAAAGVVTLGDTTLTAGITTATTTTILASPAASTTRKAKWISLHNNHASTSTTLRVEKFDATNAAVLKNITLLAGETLEYMEGVGWTHYDANGGVYPALPVATQAQMEAAADLISVVTPGRMRFHPGVAKFVAMTTGTATPALQTPPSYNVTSITDNGVGDLTVTLTTAFSSVNWCCLSDCEPISVTFTAIANVMRSNIRFGGIAAGSIRLTSLDWSATTNVIRDPITWHVAGFGDHA